VGSDQRWTFRKNVAWATQDLNLLACRSRIFLSLALIGAIGLGLLLLYLQGESDRSDRKRKTSYNLALRDEKTERNPLVKLRLVREPSGRVRYLTDDEETRLLEALLADADRQRVLVLVNTGLRKSEFLGLRWRDVDFKAGMLTVPRSKNGEARHRPR
jgi:integrase